jgi:hypothetical protein
MGWEVAIMNVLAEWGRAGYGKGDGGWSQIINNIKKSVVYLAPLSTIQ